MIISSLRERFSSVHCVLSFMFFEELWRINMWLEIDGTLPGPSKVERRHSPGMEKKISWFFRSFNRKRRLSGKGSHDWLQTWWISRIGKAWEHECIESSSDKTTHLLPLNGYKPTAYYFSLIITFDFIKLFCIKFSVRRQWRITINHSPSAAELNAAPLPDFANAAEVM